MSDASSTRILDDFQILIVDDDPSFRDMFLKLLRTIHSNVLTAASAEEALRYLREVRPEIIFTDVNLQGMSGVELTKMICSEDPTALVAVLTGFADESLVIEALKAGASDFLKKPFSASDLKATLARFVGVLARRSSKVFRHDVLESAKLDLVLQSSTHVLLPSVTLLSQLLAGSLDERELMRVELGIQEILRNAYEHGNLGLTSEEKKLTSEAERLEKELAERGRAARAENKVIRVSAAVEHGIFRCTVEDDGIGFDWRKTAQNGLNPQPAHEPHGRGLLLIRKVFDEIIFNEQGNAVTVVKRLNVPGATVTQEDKPAP